MSRRRRHLEVSTFPFLAVLLCTMGSLILLLLVLDRRAKIVALLKARNDYALVQAEKDRRDGDRLRQEADEERTARERQAEWERRNKELHALLTQEEEDVGGKIHQADDQLQAASAKLQAERALAEKQKNELQIAQMRLFGIKQTVKAQQEAAVQADHQTEAAKRELQKQTAELVALEQTLASLKTLRERQKNTYSLVPYLGRRGDNRRPVYVECAAASVIFHPERVALEGPELFGPRIRAEVEKRIARQREQTPLQPGQAPPRPYLLMLVRPDGIGNYYRTQEALAGMQVDFGYEFIEPDWVLDFSAEQNDAAAQPWMTTTKLPAQLPAVQTLSPRTFDSSTGSGMPLAPSGGSLISGGTRAALGPAGSSGSASLAGTSGKGGGDGPWPGTGEGQPGSGFLGKGGGPGGNYGSGTGAGGSGLWPGAGNGGGNAAAGNGQPGFGANGPGGSGTGNSIAGNGQPGFGTNGPGGSGTGGGAWNGQGNGGGAASAKQGGADPNGQGPAGSAGGGMSPGAGSGGGNSSAGNGQPTDGLTSSNGIAPGMPPSPDGVSSSGGANGPPQPGATGSGGPANVNNGQQPGTAGNSGDAPAVSGQAGSGGSGSGGTTATGDGTSTGSAGGNPSPDRGSAQPGGTGSDGGGSGQSATTLGATSSSAGGSSGMSAGGSGFGIGGRTNYVQPGYVQPGTVSPKVVSPPPLGRILANRDWLIYIECNGNGVVVKQGNQKFSAESLAAPIKGEHPLVQAVREMVARRQATVREGEPPYRPLLRFQLQPDGMRAYYLAYPLLDVLKLPMTRENVERPVTDLRGPRGEGKN
jgi:hypothetical protein